ncbi:hypothetical protein L6164_024502 [Bauhinia variegata]|uniref:Uncharacterized protein n=1 Tax=Bauhinia variegata TaxID=167791 RepID=A0ACB9LXU4_BAUVA|nr:hypothetical protein L6164_024502 [Bauhinia variegata]
MFEESTSSLWAAVISWFTPTVFFVLLNLMIGTIVITSSLANQKHQQQQHQNDYPRRDSQGHDPYRHPQELARSTSVLQRLKSINFSPYRSREPAHYSPEIQTHYSSEHTHEQQQQHSQPQLARSPSMLQRIKSINLYNYFPTAPASHVQTTHEPETHFDFSEIPEPEKHHLDETLVVESEDDDEYENDEVGPIRTQHQQPDLSLDEIYSQLQGGASHVTRTVSDTKPASGEVPPKLSKKMKKSATTKSAFSHFKEDDIVVENRRPATVREGKVSSMEADEEVDAKADDFINKFKKQLQLQRLDSIIRYKEMINRGSASANAK